MRPKAAIAQTVRSTVQNRGEIVLDITKNSKSKVGPLSPQQLGGVSRASNMLVQAERLYEQDPSHQHEMLLKTARRLLQALQAQADKRS